MMISKSWWTKFVMYRLKVVTEGGVFLIIIEEEASAEWEGRVRNRGGVKKFYRLSDLGIIGAERLLCSHAKIVTTRGTNCDFHGVRQSSDSSWRWSFCPSLIRRRRAQRFRQISANIWGSPVWNEENSSFWTGIAIHTFIFHHLTHFYTLFYQKPLSFSLNLIFRAYIFIHRIVSQNPNPSYHAKDIPLTLSQISLATYKFYLTDRNTYKQQRNLRHDRTPTAHTIITVL